MLLGVSDVMGVCIADGHRPDPARPHRARTQCAGCLLASCDMSTLYLRNVPDDVLDRLKLLAARESLSVSAMAVRELAESTRRADNAALLRDLPDLELSISEVVAALDEARTEV